MYFAREYMTEFVQAQQQCVELSISLSVVWKLPEQIMVKINFDGAKFQNKRAMGLGAVVRSLCGHSLWVDGCLEAEVIEAMAALEAIKLAR